MRAQASLVTPLPFAGRPPLAQLRRALSALGDLSRRTAEVDALLAALPPLALGPLAFHLGGYARTLVHRQARFELVLLTWDRGSAAPVHDHDGQDCWFLPLAGAFDLVDYALDGGSADGAGGRARLTKLSARRVGAGELDHRDLQEAVHSVSPSTTPALSLHLYARPLDRCRVFDRRHDRWRWMALGYDARAAELAG